MKTRINSEIGKLEGVILHTPGSEVENMTPENAERALYSDILNLSIASKEFTHLSQVLSKVTRVFEVKDLLSEILREERVKIDVLRKIARKENIPSLEEKLWDFDPVQLSTILVEGLRLQKNNLTNYLSNERFLMRPLHNLFFTRDASMGMNEKILLGKMANPVRERETLLMESIFQNHPDIETQTISPDSPSKGLPVIPQATIEGGDFQVAKENIYVIGSGVRTSTQGIDFIIESLKLQKSEPHHIIVQELPESPESFIHLDMVFTFLDKDACMVYDPILKNQNRLKTIHIHIDNNKVKKIEEENCVVSALKKLGVDLQPISCGGGKDSWIQEREQWHSGANFFAFAPGKVIGYERNSYTIQELNNNGFEVLDAQDVISGKVSPDNYKRCVIQIPGSELARGGGGARCMTMPFRRAEVSW